MTEFQISFGIIAVLALALLAMPKWRNKDNSKVRKIVLGVFLVCAALFLVTGCTIQERYRPSMEVGMHYQPGNRVYGDNPVGTVRLKQPVWSHNDTPRAWLEYEHHSSVPNNDDLRTTDQWGVMFNIPLGRSK